MTLLRRAAPLRATAFFNPSTFSPINMSRTLFLLLSFFFVLLPVSAQKDVSDTDRNLISAALKGWHVRLGAGFNVGGTAPLPLPREIRAIEGYRPRLNIAIEGTAHKRIGETPWGVIVGLRLEEKGMTTHAKVKNYHMEAMNADGSGEVRGAWTGKVKTHVANSYITLPVLATYAIGSRWQVQAGPYFSYRTDGEFTGEAYDGYIRDIDPTGEKHDVSSATFDFSGHMRRFHWGVQAGGEFRAYRHLIVALNLQWGMNGIFPTGFESVTFPLYPIYATVGFNYLF